MCKDWTTLDLLTASLPPFIDKMDKHTHECVSLDMERGTSFMWGLLHQDEITVARNFVSAGSVFKQHSHASKEWILVYIGELSIHHDNKVTQLKPTDSLIIAAGEPHFAAASVDTWSLVVTIPASMEWPK